MVRLPLYEGVGLFYALKFEVQSGDGDIYIYR